MGVDGEVIETNKPDGLDDGYYIVMPFGTRARTCAWAHNNWTFPWKMETCLRISLLALESVDHRPLGRH